MEPDEIDVLDSETSGGTNSIGDGDGDPATGDGDGDVSTSTGDGDGDGDASMGTGDGDGDGDPTGDGDGDPTGDGDGDPTGDGDGDGDGPCDLLPITEAFDGANDVTIPNLMSSLMAECGADGPEQLFHYEASATGLTQFEVVADVDTSVYLLGAECDPAFALTCAMSPDAAELMMDEGDVVFVVVDSWAGPGTGTLTITPPN